MLNSLPHPDDERILAAARDALLTGMSNVFIVKLKHFLAHNIAFSSAG